MRKLFVGNDDGHNSGLWMISLTGVVFVLIAWFIAYLLAQGVIDHQREAFAQARQAQVEACERKNELRAELNIQVDVLQEFLVTAAEFRDLGDTDMDAEAARAYRELSEPVNQLEIVDCQEVVPNYTESLE